MKTNTELLNLLLENYELYDVIVFCELYAAFSAYNCDECKENEYNGNWWREKANELKMSIK